MSQARYLDTAKDYTGLGLLTSLLVITVLLVPLFQAMSLLASWYAPLATGLTWKTSRTLLVQTSMALVPHVLVTYYLQH